jgi:hypothetical protein
VDVAVARCTMLGLIAPALLIASCNAPAAAQPACHSWLPAIGSTAATLPSGSGILVFDRLDYAPGTDATWMWSGSCWREEPAFGGHPVFGPALASDPSSSSVVAYGGWDATASDAYVALYETWQFHGGAWKQVLGNGPKLSGPTAIDDPSLGGVFLIGADADTEETWLLSKSGWRQLHPEHSPPSRLGASLGIDPTTRELIAYGGFRIPKDATTNTWRWTGSDWQLDTAATNEVLLPVSGLIVADHHSLWLLASARYSNQVQLWRWSAGTWARVDTTTPGPRLLGFGAAFDGHEILVFGGLDEAPGTGGKLNTAEWAWNGKSWRRLH